MTYNVFSGTLNPTHLTSLLVGRQEGHPVCKWGYGGSGHWLVWMEWRPAGWSVCLPPLIFPCTTKSRSSLLAPAHSRRVVINTIVQLQSYRIPTQAIFSSTGDCIGLSQMCFPVSPQLLSSSLAFFSQVVLLFPLQTA